MTNDGFGYTLLSEICMSVEKFRAFLLIENLHYWLLGWNVFKWNNNIIMGIQIVNPKLDWDLGGLGIIVHLD